MASANCGAPGWTAPKEPAIRGQRSAWLSSSCSTATQLQRDPTRIRQLWKDVHTFYEAYESEPEMAMSSPIKELPPTSSSGWPRYKFRSEPGRKLGPALSIAREHQEDLALGCGNARTQNHSLNPIEVPSAFEVRANRIANALPIRFLNGFDVHHGTSRSQLACLSVRAASPISLTKHQTSSPNFTASM